ncbi:MAG: AAA family ATPase [Wenzhouxiangellaceae bacterium]|nr:AAA family ATPase [Wenzhouxiangellaceae bacterium]
MRNTLIEALRRPEVWPHPVERVELIETHISWVLLAGDYACKIKKPVDLGFLDFSTLEKRRFFCDEELRLNRRTAPGLYLDVVAITGEVDAPEIGGEGPALEYAVRMRRFDSEATFDRLLAAGELGAEDIDQLAENLAGLHETAAVAPPDSRHGTFRAIAGPMRDNFTALNERLEEPRLAALADRTRNRLHELNPVIEQRRVGGMVRECHGDAHLGNVARIDGSATLFDCIEFNPDLRWIDTVCDLAFTVMDLFFNAADELAWRLLDRYLERTGDYPGMQLLPLYIVYRALVRAKVGAFRLDDDQADREAVRADIERHIALAERIAGQRRPALFITMGVSGSGKSWLAERLVRRCGLIRIRSDVERKRLFGLPPGASGKSEVGRGLYTREAGERTYDRLVELARPVIEAGLPVLIDAACLKKAQRDRFSELADSMAIPFGILQTIAKDELLQERIARRNEEGGDPSDAGLEVLAHQQKTCEPPAEVEDRQVLTIDSATSDGTDRVARWIAALLGPAQD